MDECNTLTPVIMVLIEDEMNADSFFIRRKTLLKVLAKMFENAIRKDVFFEENNKEEQDELIEQAVQSTKENIAEYFNAFLEKYQRENRSSLFFCDVPIQKDISDEEDRISFDLLIECLRNIVE